MNNVSNDTNLTFDNLDLGEGFDAAVESDLPIPEGRYLAVVTGVELKHNPDKGSVGYLWKLSVNADNEGLGEPDFEWNPTAKTVRQTYYSYIGKLVNGSMHYGDSGKPGFGVLNILRALGQIQKGETSFKLKPENVIGRQLIVTLVGEADFRERSQGVPEDEATKVLTVKNTNPYFVEGQRAPILPSFEALREQLEAANERRRAAADDDDSDDIPF